jgi:hypothetical protein
MADILQEFLTQIGLFFNDAVSVYIIPNLKVIAWIIIILVIAYIVGRVSKIIVVKILGGVGFKKLTTRTWSESVLRITGYKGTIVGLIGDIVKWIVYILFLAFIIQNIGLAGVADIFTQTAGFLPRIIGAILIIVLGFIVADFFGKIFEEAGRRFLQEDGLSSLSGGVVRYSIAIISVIMALAFVGIDTIALTVMMAVIFSAFMVMIIIGVKDIFPNFTAGLHLKKALKPGETISIGGHSGVVDKVNALTITLKSGNKSTNIPNSDFIKKPTEKIKKS